jgi:hypothetical protein
MFIKDPEKSKDTKYQEKSVSLTIMVVSFLLIVVFGALQCFEKVKDTGPFMELFIISVSLYYGRHLPSPLSGLLNRLSRKKKA